MYFIRKPIMKEAQNPILTKEFFKLINTVNQYS